MKDEDHVIEVWSRLFDHRPFLRGEIKSFVHNFESRYPGGEAPDLGPPLEQTRQVSGELVDRCRELLAETLPALLQDADLVESQCRALLHAAATDDKVKDRAAELQIQREEEWGRFLTELEQQKADVEHEFAQKEAELREYYRRAEEKYT